MEKKSIKNIALNKKARHDYFVEDTYEAGIELAGTEVKSIRQGGINLKDSYCIVKNGELLVVGMHISPYEKGNIFNRDPLRSRRLLMHKREINKLNGHVMRDGYALVPLSVYFKGPLVKVEVGLCKGKKLYDKREDLARKQAGRELERELKEKNR
ncbi:MAG: SsrA-binding protein SmpB [Clostridia bacterium]|nr:SsrA-binding protein SmpB [Clostridia bacterium]